MPTPRREGHRRSSPAARAGELLRRIAEEAADGIAAVDRDLRVIALNDAFRDAFRDAYARDVGLGADLRTLLAHLPAERGRTLAAWERAARGEAFTVTGSARRSRRAERVYECTFAPLVDAVGAPCGAYVILREVTALVHTRAAAQGAVEQTRRLQVVTAALAAAVTASDVVAVMTGAAVDAAEAQAAVVTALGPDARHLTVLQESDGAAAAVALRRAILAGRLATEVAHEGRPIFVGSRGALERRDPTLAAGAGETGADALAILPLSVAGRPLGTLGLVYAAPRAFAEAERAFLVALAQQCAQALARAHLFDAERDARAQAQQASLAKSGVLSTVSHELRTPLNAIAGYAELLQLGVHGPVSPAQSGALDRIRAAERHLLGVIDQLLHLTRAETGAIEYDLRDVPVREAVAAAHALVAPQLQARDIAFETGACDPAVSVWADAEKLQQILVNLLGNASKFTAPGGRVSVTCGVEGHVVVLRVRDTGVGVPADKIEAIFQPFVQLDRAGRGSDPARGVGLGLAISRQLARGMGGELAVESGTTVGSVFALRLPRASRTNDTAG